MESGTAEVNPEEETADTDEGPALLVAVAERGAARPASPDGDQHDRATPCSKDVQRKKQT